MNYNKDKQIAFQGIYKAVMQQEKDPLKGEDYTYAIIGRLQEKYPLEEEVQVPKSQPQKSGERCPSCGSFMIFREGDGKSKFDGSPTHWRGMFCPNSRKDGKGRCQQKPIFLPHYGPKQMERDRLEDQLQDEASQHFDEQIPPEYQ
jgi:hypothetical protein